MNEEQFKALSEEQRKTLQRELQAKGLYPADARIDGVWGPATGAALKLQETRQGEQKAAERRDALEAERLAIEKLKAQSGSEQSTAKTEALRQTTAAKKAYNEQSSSPLGVGTSIAAGVPALLAGTYLGSKSGEILNQRLDASQAAKNQTLAEAAADRMKGVTTRRGAVSGTTIAGAMPSRYAAMRVAGRMAPHIGLGAIGIGKGASMLASEREGDPSFYPEMANRAGGIGLIGAGSGMLAQGIKQGVSPGVPPDAKSISIIQSEGLRRNNATPTPKAPTPGTLAALKQEARDLQIPGRSKLTTRGALQTAIENARKGVKALPKSGILAPLAAGALAYQATRNPAEAGQEGGTQTEAATNAALASGTAAGTARLVQRYAPRVLGALGRMSGPMALAEGAGEIGKRLSKPGATAGGVVGDMYQEGFGNATDAFQSAMADFIKFLAEGQGPDQAAGPYTP